MSRRGENIYRLKDGRYEGRYVIGHTGPGAHEVQLCAQATVSYSVPRSAGEKGCTAARGSRLRGSE